MKRTRLTRRTPLRPTYWVRGKGRRKNGARRSPTAENGTATWHKTRVWVQDRANGRCEARVDAVCTVRGVHAHHVRLRSQGGSDGPENLLWVCQPCHTWIHDHPADAAALGLIARRAA